MDAQQVSNISKMDKNECSINDHVGYRCKQKDVTKPELILDK